jgi:hypothetical protein
LNYPGSIDSTGLNLPLESNAIQAHRQLSQDSSSGRVPG